MLYSGLVSISFRALSPENIICAALSAGLDGIEWGGDVHVPPGDIEKAAFVRSETENAGLIVFAYGSYFRAGCSPNPEAEFSNILASAVALNAPVIRVWASDKGSAELGEDGYSRLITQTRLAADMAAERGITLSFECHGNTYTDDYSSALRLIGECGRDNVKMYWQSNQLKSDDYNLAAAHALAPFTTNIHVFHWIGGQKLSLKDGVGLWGRYINAFSQTGRGHAFLLEFMHDGRPESLTEKASTLKTLLHV